MNVERDRKIAVCINSIPIGNVASYGQIASLAGIKRGHRVIAMFLRTQTFEPDLPWYRVLRADGKIAMEPDSQGFITQSKQLAAEGVLVKSGKVDLAKYQWQPDMDFFLFHPDL